MRKDKNKKIKSAPSTERVKRFPKFGVLDVAIILLIISIIVGLAFKYNFFNSFVKFQNLDECAVSYSVKNIPQQNGGYFCTMSYLYCRKNINGLGGIFYIAWVWA